jgi:translation initiation factor 2 gamma subunit (eIF-2gamma)
LHAAVGQAELEQLGEKLATAKKIAPTRPHPDTPGNPLVQATMGTAAAVVDHARDVVTGRANENPPDPQSH